MDDATRYRWLLAQLQAVYDNPHNVGIGPVAECFTAWGHRTQRQVTATLSWIDKRDEPLNLSAAIDKAMGVEHDTD